MSTISAFSDKRIVEVSAGGLVSGTGVRGALSEKIKRIRQEVAQSEGRVILFIDETHALFTDSNGPDDLAHELKAALARGELPCIGATTTAEYRKYFEKDPALARRFTPIHIQEPSKNDAIQIIGGIAPKYEVHHQVKINSEAIASAVELSVRYLPNQSLPDKAIGLIDLAAARARRREQLEVSTQDIADVVSEQVRVPVQRLTSDDGERLLELEDELHRRIVGHSDQIESICDALRKGAAGFYGDRPLATFLFLGSTGVGKTETAKAINDVFFPGCAMSRLDMSEFSEAHSVSRLLGAPPGYIGHDGGGQLTEAVRHRPYQLVLLDEIEKAHLDVLQALLPMLDEGRLTDGHGRLVDFKNTIVVMTSNLGAEVSSTPRSSIGFGGANELSDIADKKGSSVLGAARKALPPEIWNRIDEPLYFGSLSKSDVGMIASRLMNRVATNLRRRHSIDLDYDQSLIDTMIEAGGFDEELGARPMKRVIGRLVEAPIAKLLLSKKGERLARIKVRGRGGKVQVSSVPVEIEAAE